MAPAHVVYARNITDVDDKINARAARDFPGLPLNEAIGKVTQATERQFHDDAAALGCLPPDEEPHATDHIADMVAMIERLCRAGPRLCRRRQCAVFPGGDGSPRPARRATDRWRVARSTK